MTRRLGPLLAVLLALLLAGCARDPLYRQEAFVFGTRVEVLVYGQPRDRAQAAAGAVLREFDRLHHMLHAWQPSELSQLNAALARGETFTATPELAAMLADARRLSLAGDGLFEPALGALVALWGFHADEFQPQRPDPAQLQALVRARPRIADLEIDGTRISSRNRAVQLDLGGYAKGYALDRARALLLAAGVRDALINIGGNVMALGSKAGQPWQIGIQHPRRAEPMAMLQLKDGEAVGTSGDYQRYFELDGRRYSHLIDPRSGRPAEGTQAVTVLVGPGAGAGTLSDAASKPLFIGGGERLPALAAALGVSRVLRVDGTGRVSVTPPMQARLTWLTSPPQVDLIAPPHPERSAVLE